MKEIQLTQGKFALVDDEDYEFLSRWQWHARRNSRHWYAQRNEGKKPFRGKVMMHRLVMNAPDGLFVDHINGNGLDNRRANLRLCTTTENAWNRDKSVTNTSGYKGVFLHKRDRVIYAAIRIDGKQKHLGSFATLQDAARAYDAAAIKHFGKFAKTNFSG